MASAGAAVQRDERPPRLVGEVSVDPVPGLEALPVHLEGTVPELVTVLPQPEEARTCSSQE